MSSSPDAWSGEPTTTSAVPPPESAARSPAMVGRYVVLEELGRGGMGSVVRAYDPKLGREVALKRVLNATLSPTGEARLIDEARSMAQLSHPNVVCVYDVEVGAEGVTIVMEYVRGDTMRDWLAAEERPWQEVLAMLRQSGRGLAAAHRVGLVHRDFKPANILVTSDGRPMVTDFGLAISARARDSESGRMSATSDHAGTTDDDDASERDGVAGTPSYMAPEQHEGQVADASADQYALCVTLWRALTGAAPFKADSMSALATLKREGPPQWPRSSHVPGDIVAAIRRGMAPDPAERWPSIEALLEALSVRPRRRAWWWAAFAGAVAMAATYAVIFPRSSPCEQSTRRLAGVWDEDVRSRVRVAMNSTGVAYAKATSSRTIELLDAYAEAWVDQHEAACEAAMVRGEQTPGAYELRVACLDRAHGALAEAANVLADADGDVVLRAVKVASALPPSSHCLDIERLRAEPPLPTEPAAVAEVEHRRSELTRLRALLAAGRHQPAVERGPQLVAAAQALGFGPLTAEALNVHGRALIANGDYEHAVAVLESALDTALRHDSPDAASIATKLATVTGDRLRRPAEGVTWAKTAVALADGPRGSPTQRIAALNILGGALLVAGQPKAAVDALDRALEGTQRIPGSGALAGQSLTNLASALSVLGRHTEAEDAGRRAVAMIEDSYGPDHPNAASALNMLAGVLAEGGALLEGEVLLRRAIEVRRAALGPDHPQLANSLDNLAGLLARLGRLEEANETASRAFAIAEARYGPGNAEMAVFHMNLASIHQATGNVRKAETHLRRALEIERAAFGPEHPDLVYPLVNLGSLLYVHERDEGCHLFERAFELATTQQVASTARAEAAMGHADCLWQDTARRAEAVAIVGGAVDPLRGAGADPKGSGAGDALDRWLEQHRVDSTH